MEPPFGDSPTIPMRPGRDDAPQPPAAHYPPQYAQQYPPTAAWPAPPPPQAQHPYQVAPYAPRVRQAVGGNAPAAGGAENMPRMPRHHALALAGQLKRWSVALAVAAFAAFVGLAAAHVTGVTAAQSNSSTAPNTNATQRNNGDDGGFFGGRGDDGDGGGFFGPSGNSGAGAPSTGTTVS
jgi:hypothetical protein